MNVQQMKYGVAVLLALLLSTTSVSADIFDVIAGRQPILPVHQPTAEETAKRVEVRKPANVGHDVINPLTPLFPRQTVVGYKLETHYETKWVKIPTTLYRPAVDFHARPGESILFKPVETFTWQLRQVPVNSYRPILEDSPKNFFSRTYLPRLGDILEPIFPHYDASATASPSEPYYNGNPQGNGTDSDSAEKTVPVQPADQRPKLDPDVLKQPGSTDTEAHSTLKVELPSDAEGESVLKKPIVTPDETPADEAVKDADSTARDPQQPIPDPDAKSEGPDEAAPAKPEPKTTAPELVNPLDRTVRTELPKIGSYFVVPASIEQQRTANVPLNDEGWVPVK
ncbi:MAG: hypothetical protein VX738_03220 [Planctomycetota bacterium]|nr:hypothetical protein [Planctomycetota bacterium]